MTVTTVPERARVVRSVCPFDCPDRCSLLAHVADAKVVGVTGNPDHPVTEGFLCRKMRRYPELLAGPERLLHPLMRTGPKGSGRFRRVSWDEAVDAIARRWTAIVESEGPGAILPFYGSGTQGLVHGHLAGKRFFNRLGTLQLDRTICTKAGRLGYAFTMGSSRGADPRAIAGCKLVVAWGTNTSATNVHHLKVLGEARKSGARYAVVNPVRVDGSSTAHHLLQPEPGTDAALALGMMQVIIQDELFDRDFVARCTHGFAELKARAAEYPPERVARITGTDADEIRRFARAYAELKPSFIHLGSGCQHHTNGGMTVRTIACLPALVGAWRYPGGGLYYPTSTILPLDLAVLEGEELRPQPPRSYNMNHLGRMLAAQAPRIQSLYVFDGNPAAVLFDQKRLRRGLGRQDLFTVVHDLFMTDTARYADLVLPATSQFEQVDLFASYYDLSLHLGQRAAPPPPGCKSNLETFALLARAMGLRDFCFAQEEWDVVAGILCADEPALGGVTLAGLVDEGHAPLAAEPTHERFRDGGFPTPSGKIELYSAAMEEAGFDPLPAYLPLRESRVTAPETHARYPLHFLTPSGHSFLNSTFAQAPGHVARERRPTLVIHPADAGPRGIAEGDVVRVVNDRGSALLWAAVSDHVRPGVVASAGQWWDRHYPGGRNANHTTPDFAADMGGGSAFNTNLVEVERASLAEACGGSAAHG